MRRKLVATLAVLASGSAEETARLFNDRLELPDPLPATTTRAEFLTWYPLVFTPEVLAAIRQDLARIAQDPTGIVYRGVHGVQFGKGYLRFNGQPVSGDPRYLAPDIRMLGASFPQPDLQARQATAEEERKAKKGDEWFTASMRQKLVATMELLASGSAEKTAPVFNDRLPLPYPLAGTTTHAEFLAWYPFVFTPKTLAALRADFARIQQAPGKIENLGWRGAMFGDGYLCFNGNAVPGHPQYLDPGIGNFCKFFDDRKDLDAKRLAAIEDLRTRLLHPSLGQFSEPFCDGSTPTWRFRMDRLDTPERHDTDAIRYVAADGQDRYQGAHGPKRYRLSIWPKDKPWTDPPTYALTVVQVREHGGTMGDNFWYVSEEIGLIGGVDLMDFGESNALGSLTLHDADRVLIHQPIWELHR